MLCYVFGLGHMKRKSVICDLRLQLEVKPCHLAGKVFCQPH